MHELMNEFSVEVLSSIVIISTNEPESKKIYNYESLLLLDEHNEDNILKPSPNIIGKLEE